jgi:hypothetical protein
MSKAKDEFFGKFCTVGTDVFRGIRVNRGLGIAVSSFEAAGYGMANLEVRN